MINNSEVHLKLQVHPHRLLLLPWRELMTRGNVNFCEDFFFVKMIYLFIFCSSSDSSDRSTFTQSLLHVATNKLALQMSPPEANIVEASSLGIFVFFFIQLKTLKKILYVPYLFAFFLRSFEMFNPPFYLDSIDYSY